MTFSTLIRRSLRFRVRAHLGVVLGAMVGSAALIGALVVGDSVRHTLHSRALQRLGWVQAAMDGGDRFFPQELAERVVPIKRSNPSAISSWDFDAVLQLPGTASREDGRARANHVTVLGVDTGSFWQSYRLTNERPAFTRIPPDGVVLNEALAAQLQARTGDVVVLRVHKPSALSRDVPIAPQNEASVALRLKVDGIAPASHLGNFSLRAGQGPPLNAFLPINSLAPAAGLPLKANLILAGDFRTQKPPPPAGQLLERLREYLWPDSRKEGRTSAEEWSELTDWEMAWRPRLEDYQLQLRPVTNQSVLELRSERIFLERAVREAVYAPGTNRPSVDKVPLWSFFAEDSPVYRDDSRLPPEKRITDQRLASLAQPVLTYLVNQFRTGDRTTPYSMVTAAGPPWTPPDMGEDEVIVNQWLADDLRINPGDSLDLSYFVADSGVALVERTNRFRVRAIVPLAGFYADGSLMPEFPGLAKAESTHDWDAGFPLVHKIREQDEQYWKQYRGTPKAFVTLAAGQKMWGNRFGNLTSIRFPVPPGDRVALEHRLLQGIDPSKLGLRFEPVRARALAAAEQAQDFGGLFLGFSFFLILAALILMALLFQFGLEQRTAEVGTLLALGFTPKRVRKLLLIEGAALALGGGLVGLLGGLVYARAMLFGLTTLWREAVNASALEFHATATSLAIGVLSSFVVSALTIAIVLRQQARRPARELLAAEGASDLPTAKSKARGSGRSRWIAGGTAVAAIAAVGWSMATGQTANAEIFFSAGSLLLMSGLAGTAALLGALANSEAAGRLSVSALGLRGSTRRRKRSLAVVGLLASGSFLVASIGAFRLDANQGAEKRSSGTGGFALIGESTLPVVKDLNTREGREAFGLDEKALAGVTVVPFRVRDGDDASCLNLNRAQQPKLLGLNFGSMPSAAFTFAKTLSGADGTAQRWGLLGRSATNGITLGPDEVAGIGDAASIQWAMHKRVGDTVEFVDEGGRPFKVRLVGALANSILQGSLIIDEAEFVRRFPGESGYRMFLIDAPSNSVPQVSALLTRALQDVGLEVTSAARRLAAFNAVQNTYLNTFQVLGGLGLLLGSAGLGVVVLRNVLERRGELALLQAVGFRRRKLEWLVLSEHGGLLGIGLTVGLAAALVAILPVLLAPGAEIHYRSLVATLSGVLAAGLVGTWAATRLALRGNLVEALRQE